MTPGPAITEPFTGGQNLAHWPLHLEVVLVSGANQYRVKPLMFVSTEAPSILAAFTRLLGIAAPAPVPVVPGVPELPELPHPVAISAAAARLTGTSHLLPMQLSPFLAWSPRYE